MTPLDAITDLLNKLLDKAQSVAPTVWEAALRQAQIDAQRSLYWGYFWTAVAGVFLLVALGMVLAARATLRTYEKHKAEADADYTLKLAAWQEEREKAGVQMEPYGGYSLGPSRDYPKFNEEERPFAFTIMGIALALAVLPAVLAIGSYWDAYQISNNPTWYAIKLLKG